MDSRPASTTAPSYVLAVGTILGSMVLYACTANIVFAALLHASESFHAVPERFAAVTSVQFSGYLLACLIAGIASDRLGKKQVLCAGFLLSLLGVAGWGLSPSPKPLYAFSFVMGIGGGVLESVGSAMITDIHPEKSKYYMNLTQIFYCVGAVGLPFVMAFLLPHGVPWRFFFFAVALLALALTLCCMRMALPAGCGANREHGNLRTTLRLLPSIAVPAICLPLYVFTEMGTATFVNVYLRKTLHAPENVAILGISIFWGAMIAGRFCCTRISQSSAYEPTIAGMLGVSALCTASQCFATSWQAGICCFFLMGFAFSGIWPMIVGMATARNPENSGTASGLTISAGSVGCIIQPFILGPLLENNHHKAVFCLLAFCLLLSASIMTASYCLRTRRR